MFTHPCSTPSNCNSARMWWKWWVRPVLNKKTGFTKWGVFLFTKMEAQFTLLSYFSYLLAALGLLDLGGSGFLGMFLKVPSTLYTHPFIVSGNISVLVFYTKTKCLKILISINIKKLHYFLLYKFCKTTFHQTNDL